MRSGAVTITKAPITMPTETRPPRMSCPMSGLSKATSRMKPKYTASITAVRAKAIRHRRAARSARERSRSSVTFTSFTIRSSGSEQQLGLQDGDDLGGGGARLDTADVELQVRLVLVEERGGARVQAGVVAGVGVGRELLDRHDRLDGADAV